MLRIPPEGIEFPAPASALVTFPAQLSSAAPSSTASTSPTSHGDWVKSVASVSDACVELQGFACEWGFVFWYHMLLSPDATIDSLSPADPLLPQSFPHSHGLTHLLSFPSLHTLLPSAYKHSSLLGLGVGSTGQNNLSFRLKRKRFVLETLHLGVEGGVGERRTEPPATMKSVAASTTGGGGQPAHVHTDQCSHSHGRASQGVESSEPGRDATPRARFAAMDISVEAPSQEHNDAPISQVVPTTLADEQAPAKKERKKVAFIQHDRPELYEF